MIRHSLTRKQNGFSKRTHVLNYIIHCTRCVQICVVRTGHREKANAVTQRGTAILHTSLNAEVVKLIRAINSTTEISSG